MQEDVYVQSQPIQRRYRFSDPICVNAKTLYYALQEYEEKSSFLITFGMASEPMKRLRLLCERLKENQKNSLHTPYLQPEELFELAKILFEEKAEQDDITGRVIKYLKKITRFDQIEAAYDLARKSNNLNFQLFQVLYGYPLYVEKNIALFYGCFSV